MNVGHRHFGGGDQIVIPVHQFKQIFFKFRQLAGMGHALPVDDKRRQRFGISMRLGVNIEHKINKGSFQSGAGTIIKRKACPCNFSSPLKVQNPQLCSDVPVRLGFEIKFRPFTNNCNHRVIGFIFAHWHRSVGDVGYAQQDLLKGVLSLG